ncbi:MAG: peptidyl-prolyl cis-trans isomerase [Deltaproteobacteria bacterium]|nr:peptidyl-prolyl cis-trans isomerase [Deltaproteobacteria bacterium]
MDRTILSKNLQTMLPAWEESSSRPAGKPFVQKRLLRGVAFLLLLLTIASCSRKTDPSKVIARINGSTITYGEYDRALKELLSGENIAPEELAELKKSLINQLVEEKVILGEAVKIGLKVSREELEDEIKNMGQNLETPEMRAAILERYATTENWRKEIENRLLVKKAVETAINPRIEVTEKEAREYYEKNIPQYSVAEQVHARMIVVGTEEKAKEAKRMLEKERFEDVAKRVSIGPEAKEGGDLGFFSPGEMPPEFDVVFTLAAGKISTIVKTPYGYHIFKVEERKKQKTLSFKAVQGDIDETLFREKAEKEYRLWVLTLKKNSKIDVSEGLM